MGAPVLPTSRRAILTGAAVVGVLAGAEPAHATLGEPGIPEVVGDYFLKLTGIPGRSVRDGHEEEIELLTFSWQAAQVEGVKTGKPAPVLGGFLFAAPSDIQTPKLLEHFLAATSIASAVLSLRRTIEGETSDYLSLSMQDALVVSYQVTVNPADGQAMDVVELQFTAPPTLTFG